MNATVRRILALLPPPPPRCSPAPPPPLARDAVVTSADGTPIVTSLPPGRRASQAGRQGADDPDDPRLGRQPRHGRARRLDARRPATSASAPLRKAGFNVLTWDSRGFGESGGTVDGRLPKDYEGRDVAGADRLARTAARGAARPAGRPARWARTAPSYARRDRARGRRHRAPDRRDRPRPSPGTRLLTRRSTRPRRAGQGRLVARALRRGRADVGPGGDRQPRRRPDREPRPAHHLRVRLPAPRHGQAAPPRTAPWFADPRAGHAGRPPSAFPRC